MFYKVYLRLWAQTPTFGICVVCPSASEARFVVSHVQINEKRLERKRVQTPADPPAQSRAGSGCERKHVSGRHR